MISMTPAYLEKTFNFKPHFNSDTWTSGLPTGRQALDTRLLIGYLLGYNEMIPIF
jgi:hypothetical protein